MANQRCFYKVFVVHGEVVESSIEICTFGHTRHCAINYSSSQGDEQMELLLLKIGLICEKKNSNVVDHLINMESVRGICVHLAK